MDLSVVLGEGTNLSLCFCRLAHTMLKLLTRDQACTQMARTIVQIQTCTRNVPVSGLEWEYRNSNLSQTANGSKLQTNH